MPKDQIQNGKTWNTKSGTPTCETVLLDGIAKPVMVKHGTPNLEKYLRSMWTVPLRKKYNGAVCGNDKREYKTRDND